MKILDNFLLASQITFTPKYILISIIAMIIFFLINAYLSSPMPIEMLNIIIDNYIYLLSTNPLKLITTLIVTILLGISISLNIKSIVLSLQRKGKYFKSLSANILSYFTSLLSINLGCISCISPFIVILGSLSFLAPYLYILSIILLLYSIKIASENILGICSNCQ